MESIAFVSNKKKHHYWIFGLTILFLLIGFILFKIPQGFGRSNMLPNIKKFNNNSNIDMLKELNEDWRFPSEYTRENIKIGDMDAYWVYAGEQETDKIILQLHGGAYVNSLQENGTQYERAAVKYAEISGARILTIDYRVAPKAPYPAALEDAVTAYEWLLKQGYDSEKIIIAGDSAGGGLTLATAMYLRDNKIPMPAALITMSAWTDLNYKNRKVSYVGDHDATNPYISPIYGDFTGLPPMLLQVGEEEKLLKDTLKVEEKAIKEGVSVTRTTYDKMFHVFQLLYPRLAEANDAWDEVKLFIEAIYSSANNR